MPDLTKDEFCARFRAEMVRVAGPTFRGEGERTGESVADYADEVSGTYWDDPDMRDYGPEECATTDISYWEEG